MHFHVYFASPDGQVLYTWPAWRFLDRSDGNKAARAYVRQDGGRPPFHTVRQCAGGAACPTSEEANP